jgi:glycosyltransferase involved in cell wall biosynthesis
MPTDISVILPTYNRAASLKQTLESFARLSLPSDLKWELLVVDNNSTDGTREVIENFAKLGSFPVRYVWEQRQGRSAALNAGIAIAQGDIIAFTDDDVILHPDWLLSLKSTFDRFDCAAVAGRVVPLWKYPKPAWLEMEGQFAIVNFDLGDEIKEVRIPPLGANCAFRREIFAKYGLFRLDLGVRGSKHTITCDDTEFGNRLIEAGEKIVYAPGAVIYHPVDPERTTKKYFLSWYYYNGVSLTRTAGLPAHGTFYFGVPRWLFRELGANLCKWLFSFNGNRFQQRLNTYRSLGHILESFRLSHLTTGGDSASAGRYGLS